MKSNLFLRIGMRNCSLMLCLLAALAMVVCHSSAQTTSSSAERIEGFTDTPMLPGGRWHQHDPGRPQPPVVTPAATFSQGTAPPSDAEVLFDGKDLSKWESGPEQNPNWKGQDGAWKIQDGYVEVTPPDGTDIRTRGRWSDFQLHLEWATPNPPTGHGQARGNSGVLINGMYEIQLLDSYNDKTYPDGQAGSTVWADAAAGQSQQAARPVADFRNHLGIPALERQERADPESLRDSDLQRRRGAASSGIHRPHGRHRRRRGLQGEAVLSAARPGGIHPATEPPQQSGAIPKYLDTQSESGGTKVGGSQRPSHRERAEDRGGITQIARKAGVERESLHRASQATATPGFQPCRLLQRLSGPG